MSTPTIHEVWVEEFTDTLDEERVHFALRLDFSNDRHYRVEILDGYTADRIAIGLRRLAALLEADPDLR